MSHPSVPPPSNLADAVDHLASDGLVAFPTETVWGLAARAESPGALQRLRSFKGRADDQPISVLVDEPERVGEYGVSLAPPVSSVIRAFWPGPLTVVAPVASDAPFAPGVRGATGAVGFRCSDHPVAAQLVREAFEKGLGPLTATSFNKSGETPVETHSQAVLLAKADAAQQVIVLHCGSQDAYAQAPSTVVDFTSVPPRVLRWGAVSREALSRQLDRFA